MEETGSVGEEDSEPGDLLKLGASAIDGLLGLLGAKIDILRALLTNKASRTGSYLLNIYNYPLRTYTITLGRRWKLESISRGE